MPQAILAQLEDPSFNKDYKLQLLADALAGLAPKLRADLVIVLAADAVVTQDPAGDGSYHINRGIRETREHIDSRAAELEAEIRAVRSQLCSSYGDD